MYESGSLGAVGDEARGLVENWKFSETGKNDDGSDFSYSYNGEILQNAGRGACVRGIRDLPNVAGDVWLDGRMCIIMKVGYGSYPDDAVYACVWRGKVNSPMNPTRGIGTVTYYKKTDGTWKKEFVHDFVMTKN